MQLLNIGPSITAALDQVLEMLGLAKTKQNREKCVRMHLLAQDDSSHASFGLHVDNRDLNGLLNSVLTCVLQLSDVPTAMRLWRFPMGFVYSGRGSGCIFPGAAIHTSAPTTPPPLAKYVAFKIVFFIQ